MKRSRWIVGLAAAAMGTAAVAAGIRRRGRPTLLFVATQQTGAGHGIVAATLDEATGALTVLRTAAEVARPTWLLSDPRRPILYAVSEVGNAGDREGEVLSFAIERKTGALSPIARTSSGGGGATHLALDKRHGTVFVANFGGGQAAAIPAGAGGALSTATCTTVHTGSGPHRRQGGPHPHGVTLDPSGRFLLVPDMGADRIFVYRYTAAPLALEAARVSAVALPAGSGPRLLLFGADGRFAYMLSELSAELYVFRWNRRDGTLEQIACTPLDEAVAPEARSAAALAMTADGRFLYASNRATHAIHAYAVDRRSGVLREVQRVDAGGTKPWGAELSPSGRWLVVANQGSDRLCAFRVDRRSGRLAAVGQGVTVETPTGTAFVR